ncbi:putative Aluminum activated malate transporter family protein [Melia azedarach]|uniref:Aluminum activated malate transporter family protein n=1 Tax=Melia azedarach TaxID=155640 RepID=A0ACC1XLN0_MELAZ|nr:putative Aluminum activated malate transporter family protein [Melia azedarach]
MVLQKEVTNGLEWRIRVEDVSSETLVPAASLASRVWLGLKNMIVSLVLKVWRFLQKAWNLAVDEPRKVIHCLKVGIALTFVSLFYYMRPLYDGVGGNAMWAIMTVVVVFENTVGATISKSLNRICGTFLAGFLAIGVHWIASQSGDQLEPLIIGASVFILASAATFSRFIPSVKQRFDYGALIFILTFSLVTVSGYRVEKLFDLAHQRISTIIIGTTLCILVSMLICPIWAGKDLYNLIIRNMDKLANSLDGCVAEYFNHCGGFNESGEEAHKKILSYKCVLNTKATEESMANFARWEPAHGLFNFRHPWKQYLKIGASIRSCAYCIEALNSCINSENQGPAFVKNHLSNTCLKVSSTSSRVIKELANAIKTMKKSSTVELLVGEMNTAVKELQNDLKSLSGLCNPTQQSEAATPENKKTEKISKQMATIPLMGMISMVTFASLQIEIALRIESLVEAVEELGELAKFEHAENKPNLQPNIKVAPDEQRDEETVKTFQKV